MKTKTLAIDFGNPLGFCSGKNLHGFIPIKAKARGLGFLWFYKWVERWITVSKVRKIAYEKPTGRGQPQVMSAHGFYEGCVQMLCDYHGIKYVSVYPASLKKYITGKGRAEKEEMIARVRELMKIPEDRPLDNNQADAIAVWLWATDPEAQENEKERKERAKEAKKKKRAKKAEARKQQQLKGV